MVSIKYEKYLVYFLILSFFVLIAIISIYKKSNKILICITSIILVIQLFIVYDMNTILEPAVADGVANIKIMQGDITNISDIKGQAGKTDLGNVYAEFNVINDKQTNKPLFLLPMINQMGGGNYTSFDDLKPISEFTETNIKEMIDANQGIFMELLGTIEAKTLPK